jgi:hypothetical protein
MKLSAYAKHLRIHYDTAWRMWQRGEIAGYQLPSGTIIVTVGGHHLFYRPALRAETGEQEETRTHRRIRCGGRSVEAGSMRAHAGGETAVDTCMVLDA